MAMRSEHSMTGRVVLVVVWLAAEAGNDVNGSVIPVYGKDA
jgi:hypothetical protein